MIRFITPFVVAGALFAQEAQQGTITGFVSDSSHAMMGHVQVTVTDKATGAARDLPGVMGASGGMSGTDFHYGQNVFLPDGTYEVTVQLGPGNTAVFRDVMVMASTMMMGH